MNARVARHGGALALVVGLVLLCAAGPAIGRGTHPRLAERSISAQPASVAPGGTIAITNTVANTGGRTAAATSSTFFLATSRTHGSGDTKLGSRRVPRLKPHTASSGHSVVGIPLSTTPGAKFVLACLAHGACRSTRITVTSPAAPALESVAVTPAQPFVPKGLSEQFTATGTYSDGTTRNLTSTANWSSSDGLVASVSNAAGSQGLASALTLGPATITAAVGTITGSSRMTVLAPVVERIAVTPATAQIAHGTGDQFTATGTFSDGSMADITDAVTWSSDTPSVATISNAGASAGFASGLAPGAAVISATDPTTRISGSASLTVTSATLQSIAVTPPNPSIAKGLTQQFTATGIFSDTSTQNLTGQVTWSSGNTNAAAISNGHGSGGLATALATGSSTIHATFGAVSGSTILTVTPPVLVTLAVTPANPSVPKGLTQQFTATGTLSDGTMVDETSTVMWSSQTTSVATISNAAGLHGLAAAVGTGSSTITATDPSTSVAGTTTLTVTPPALESIAVTPANPALGPGQTLQFTATGIFTDSSTRNITTSVTWSSGTTSVATISNQSGSNGVATAGGAGTSTIKALDPSTGIQGSTVLTVT